MNKSIFIIISFLIIAISLLDIKVIPFFPEIGLDFSNNYGYHHCQESPLSIYEIPSDKCQDFQNRSYVYPPLLFQLFAWTKFFDKFESAYYFFVLLHTLSFLLIVYVWAEKNLLSLTFALGLFVTYPNLFLLERGNGDMFVALF
jgi:hypothetical protein